LPDFISFQGKDYSKSEVVFAEASRPDTTIVTNLLDMEDYTELDIFIKALSYTPPTILTSIPEDSTHKTPGSATNDGDLGTQWTDPIGYGVGGETRYYAIWDMGDSSSRSIGAKVSSTFNNQTHTWTLEGSTDTAFTTPVNVGQTTTLNDSIGFIVGSVQTFRYYRLKSSTPPSAGGSSAKVYEVYILDDFGGTVNVSIELKNPDSGIWNEIISSADIGTSTSSAEVHGHVGRQATDEVGANKNYYLPKTITDLRLKLEVTGGGSVTSVSIIKSGGL
jgi:hypothetical protein